MNISEKQLDRSKCPVLNRYDPFSSEFTTDPYQVWAGLRKESPVYYAADINHYIVTRYDDISAVYNDQDNFSAANASSPLSPLAEEAARILKEHFPRKPTLNNSDPPRHGPMRRAVGTSMGATRWRKLQPSVRTCAQGLIADLVKKPVADIVADLAFPLPAFAGFRLLGFPDTDTEMLKSWCKERVLFTYGRLDAEGQVAGAKQMVRFWRYVEEFVKRRIEEPADDLTTDLLAYSRKAPDLLNVEDINNIVYSISLAGHETTTNAIGNAMVALLQNRQQWVALCANPALIDNAVEEVLRFGSPVIGKRRIAKRDVTIGGVPVPVGSNIMLLIGSAHHDPAHFENPNQLDVTRANAGEHIAFGGPWHYCLGAPLARFEMRVVLDLLTKAAPSMRLAPGNELGFHPTATHRGPQQVLVEPRPAN
jgi:cytochrome P450